MLLCKDSVDFVVDEMCFPKKSSRTMAVIWLQLKKNLTSYTVAANGDHRNSGRPYDGTSILPVPPITVGFMKYFSDCLGRSFPPL